MSALREALRDLTDRVDRYEDEPDLRLARDILDETAGLRSELATLDRRVAEGLRRFEEPDRIVDRKGAAEYLKVSVSTLAHSEDIPSSRIGRRIVYSIRALDRYVAERQQRGRR